MSHRAWILTAILLLASLLRFVGITQTPPGPNQDEISNALDVRFLNEVGRDHVGRGYPEVLFYLTGYNDDREALYVHWARPLGAWLEPWVALRILAGIVGVATVAVTYILALRLFGPTAATCAGLFLATNPQHVLWGRIGMEVILVPFAVSLAWLAMLHCHERRPYARIFFIGALLVTMYSGMMGKPAALLVLLATLARWDMVRWYLRNRFTSTVALTFLLAVLAAPAILGAVHRRERFEDIRLRADDWPRFLATAAKNYATYWSPTYLWLPGSEGMPDLPHAAKMGYAEFVALLMGVGLIAFRPRQPFRMSLLLFLLLSPVPASITNSIAPSRFLFTLPILAVVMGAGAERGIHWLGGRIGWAIVGLGTLVTTAIVAVDLIWYAHRHLDQFFWNDERRIIETLLDRPETFQVVDMRLPFSREYAMYVAQATPREVLGPMANDVPIAPGAPIAFQKLTWGPLDKIPLRPGTAIATRRGWTIPGARTVADDGRFQILVVDAK